MKKNRLSNLVSRLKSQKKVFDRQLERDLAAMFNVRITEVRDYKIDGDDETGIIVSGNIQYRFRIGLETKELEEIARLEQ
jgi:hypothetical protein